jgi:hypothetical protein
MGTNYYYYYVKINEDEIGGHVARTGRYKNIRKLDRKRQLGESRPRW